MSSKVKVIQNPEEEVPTEILAEAICDISKGIKAIRAGRLTDKAIILLIQHAAPVAHNGARYTMGQIQDILRGMESLESVYVKRAR